MLKLYTAPGACSTACHIVLQESGVPFETKVFSFEGNDFVNKDFLKANPKGYVPFLEIDATRTLTEGTAIMQYIADQAPESNLMPTKGFERYKGLEWLNFIATECHKTFGPLFSVNEIFTNEEGKKEYVNFVQGNVKDKLDFINTSLEGKDYLMGKTFTVADAYLFTIMNWSQHLKIDLSPWKNIVGFQSRVYARPATQRALKAEGVLK